LPAILFPPTARWGNELGSKPSGGLSRCLRRRCWRDDRKPDRLAPAISLKPFPSPPPAAIAEFGRRGRAASQTRAFGPNLPADCGPYGHA
jgi:hypothetical protein